MGNVATLERMFWFDDQARRKCHPNATRLAGRFDLSVKTAPRCIDALRDRFGAPLEYDAVRKGYTYRDRSFVVPRFQVRQEDILAMRLARKLRSSTAGGFISRDIERFSRKLIPDFSEIKMEFLLFGADVDVVVPEKPKLGIPAATVVGRIRGDLW